MFLFAYLTSGAKVFPSAAMTSHGVLSLKMKVCHGEESFHMSHEKNLGYFPLNPGGLMTGSL